MEKQRTYYGYTTLAQRKLLFETWEVTGSIAEACQKARVGERTFYYWRERFKESGYAGLGFRSRAPKKPRRIGAEIERQVVEMHQAHPEWGKQRLAQELAKANNWVPVVSLNTVRRILKEAGMWAENKEKKGAPRNESRTADEAGQAVNIDLCFVPAIQTVASKLPAVSGSSGHLVVERSEAQAEIRWPGQIFALNQ